MTSRSVGTGGHICTCADHQLPRFSCEYVVTCILLCQTTAYCPVVGGPIIVMSAVVMVPFPTASNSEKLLGQRHLVTGDVLVSSSMEFLTHAFSLSLTPQVVASVLLRHHSSLHSRYGSCGKVFQFCLTSYPIMYMLQDSVPVPLFSLP